MEGKDVRRRLVQRTLFPHMDQSSTKEAENCSGDGEEGVAEEEEWRPISEKRGRKTKGVSKTKMTGRAASKKVIENGKETSSKQVDDSGSQVPSKSTFFVKYSEREKQKNQLPLTDSPGNNDETRSPPSSAPNGRSTPRKLKRQCNSTPRKERRNSTPNKKMKSGKRELCYAQIPSESAVGEQPLQTIPNLRLEAKLSAEENLRVFSGRQIHPFFASWRGGKTSQDLTDTETKWSSFQRKEKGLTFNPIHVFENVQDDHTTLDWGHWIISERSAVGGLEREYSPDTKRSVDSLNFDNFLNAPCFTRTSQNCPQGTVSQKEVSTELPDKPEHSRVISPLPLDDKIKTCIEEQKDLGGSILPIDTEEDQMVGNKNLFAGTSCSESFNSRFQDKLHQERIVSHYQASHNQSENCLWTDKYRPQNANQICGNGETVKNLSEWLHLWHQRGSVTSRSSMDEDNSIMQDADHDCQQSDSDYDTINDEESLKNVLLVTGPVGSGKSAAIYACARDQGFQIIEINASDWRNGALIKQKFGEAVESHWLQRTVENGVHSDNKSISKLFKTVEAEIHCSNKDVIQCIDLTDEEDSQEDGGLPKVPGSQENLNATSQDEIKTLILFEDVDANLCEDHGFITTIQQLAETAKRPMILTSNSSNPALPKNMNKSELSFSVPSVEELLGLVHTVCASEKANIHPCLVKRFVDYCQQDIRKTITLLQFWFQGQTLGIGNEFHTTHRPVPFDHDAGHHILPKVIHWGYHSKLSELVAEEVFKSLILIEETHGLTGIKSDNQNGSSVENIHAKVTESDPFEAKKEAMFSMHGLLDEFECAQLEANPELCDFSCSPIGFSQSRRKKYSVISSDSEDEISGGSFPLVSSGIDLNAEVLNMQNISISHCLSTDIDINAEVIGLRDIPISHCLSAEMHPTGSIYYSKVGKMEGHYNFQERVDYFRTEDTCKSHDVSRVPESSYVPETELMNETELYSATVSYGNFVNDATGANILIGDQVSMPILEPALGSQPEKSLHVLLNNQEILGNNSDTSTTFAYQEEVGDSLSRSEPNVVRGYMDECSRVPFTWRLKSLDNVEADQGTDFVKETWKRLHDPCNNLRQYVTAEERTACQVLTFTHGMSSLISEADLLLRGCQIVASDSLESAMIPSENINSCSYYDDQLEMSSTLAEHGMCLYAKEIASLESQSNLNVASEMLLSSSSLVALGKLASEDQTEFDRSDTKTTNNLNILMRKSDSCLSGILQTLVPSKAYLAAKGNAFHEYISTLSQISRHETLRMSECTDNRKQRRARASRHYLSSGSFALSPEEILLLSRYNSLP